MSSRRLGLVFLLLGYAMPAAAQNPCEIPLDVAVAIPLGTAPQIAIASPDMARTFPSGEPLIGSVGLGIFLDGVDPMLGAPVSFITIPRAAFVPVGPQYPDCYVATFGDPILGVTPALRYQTAFHTRNSEGVSAWVTGNPFFFKTEPAAPKAGRLLLWER